MPDNHHHIQDEVLRHSLEDPDDFWRHQAEHLHWHKKFSSTIQLTQKTLKNGITHDSWEWFPDGEISTCYNCVDRHVLDGHGDSVAIYFDSPVTNTKEQYTYSQLLEEVEVLAGTLREEGVKKGDVVMLYSKCMGLYCRITKRVPNLSISANDSSRRDGNPGHQPTGCHPLHCLWRLCTERPRTAH